MNEYPNVVCEDHPGIVEPGYIICPHIRGIEDVGHVEQASNESMGVLCCAACYERKDDAAYVLDTFHVVCAPGLREQGLLVKLQ